MSDLKQLPLVSIITVNYNQSDVTIALMDSLSKISYPNIEVIVVDNASPSDQPDKIKKLFPAIQLIKSDKNIGFAGGNNLGIFAAKGKYMLFINNDTEVVTDFLEPLVERLEHNPNIGVVSPKIRFHHHPDIIQYAGYTPLNYYTMRNNLVGYRTKDEGQFDEGDYTPFGHGAAMMVPRKVMEEVGLMADIFFLYYEEHDWFERIKAAGFKIYYEPKSLVYHKESISTGKESPLKIHYIARNRLVFMRRNLHGFKFFIGLLWQTWIAIPKAYTVYLLKRDFKLLKAFHRAIVWNLKNIFNEEIHQNIKLKKENL